MVRLGSGLIVLIGLVFTHPAQAHVRSESFSRWQYEDQTLSVRFTVNAREATRIPNLTNATTPGRVLAQYLSSKIAAPSPDANCRPVQRFLPVATRAGFLQAEAVWRCSEIPVALEIHAFFDLAAEHSHLASFESAGQLRQRFLSGEDRVWLLRADLPGANINETGGYTFKAFLGQGFRHILSGLDHIVFLLALLLICRRRRDIVWAVTGFTLGHSITLALATLGMVQPNVPAVEATIGLTIALIAVERTARSLDNALPLAVVCAALLLLMALLTSMLDVRLSTSMFAGLALFSFCYLLLSRELGSKGGFRILITALFGLIHGLGFAGAFLASDLSKDLLFLPLAGFNIGVELGQLALVAVILLIGALVQSKARFQAQFTELISALVCGLGVFWFVQRSFVY